MEELLARERIRDLALRYSVAIAQRDVELMVSLYAEEASFGSFGSGPDALRSIMSATMDDLRFGVILVANHLIEVTSDTEATGEVWARCYAQNDTEGYYEQLLKYIDRYVNVGTDPAAPDWRFLHRRHLLWFGEAKASPLGQPPANWPERQVGVGRIPLSDEAVVAWREADTTI